MHPFAAAQLSTLIENIRLLEAYVTAPLGLYSDIRMIRQALPMTEAGDLAQSELQQRRIGYRSLTEEPGRLALRAIEQTEVSLDMIESITDAGEAVLRAEWIAQARRVLPRARQRVGEELRSRAARKVQGLYVIVGPDVSGGGPVEEIAEAALRGGARIVQLRDKTGDRGDVLSVARRIRSLCDDHDALFIMNDDPAMALSSGAHGLHLGQTDLPVSEARRVVGHDLIIGRSNNSMEEVAASIAAGVDYLAVGAVFATSTAGKGGRPAVGTELVAKAKETADQPVVAIGGINRENVGEVVRAGADCVCVVAAVGEAADPEAAASALVEAIRNAKTVVTDA